MEHLIKTMPGPPIYSKPRSLALDRLMQVKAEIEMMLEQVVMSP
jgi:hypothetical protein